MAVEKNLNRTVAALSNSKSFEYRVSKKIAELTQVVHMLFTRNQEKEVEIEALTDAYEYEIELVQQDARGIIGRLEEKVKAIEHQLETVTQQSSSSDIELKAKLFDTEQQLQQEKYKNHKLSELLSGAEKNLETIRGGNDHELAKVKQELANARREIAEQQVMLARLVDEKQTAIRTSVEQQQKHERAEMELENVKQSLDLVTKTNEELTSRNKKLDSDLRSLRATKMQAAEVTAKPKDNFKDMEDELERLRREVQRYRMEISNRESTYNKVFTDKRPLVVGNRQKNNSSVEGSRTTASASDRLPPLSRDHVQASQRKLPNRT